MNLVCSQIPLSHGCSTCWLQSELKNQFAFNIRVSRTSALLYTYQSPALDSHLCVWGGCFPHLFALNNKKLHLVPNILQYCLVKIVKYFWPNDTMGLLRFHLFHRFPDPSWFDTEGCMKIHYTQYWGVGVKGVDHSPKLQL